MHSVRGPRVAVIIGVHFVEKANAAHRFHFLSPKEEEDQFQNLIWEKKSPICKRGDSSHIHWNIYNKERKFNLISHAEKGERRLSTQSWLVSSIVTVLSITN